MTINNSTPPPIPPANFLQVPPPAPRPAYAGPAPEARPSDNSAPAPVPAPTDASPAAGPTPAEHPPVEPAAYAPVEQTPVPVESPVPAPPIAAAPAPGTVHTVVAGDTVDSVAAAYGVSASELGNANAAAYPSLGYHPLLQVGWQLAIPAGAK